jgi:8-oxo-dGTP diphosphatase
VRYASGGVLYHADTRQVLLQHRTDDAPAYPGQWGLFGGSDELEDRGDPVATWCREVREELGIVLDPRHFRSLGEVWGRNGARHYRCYLFAYPWPAPTRDFVLGEGQGFAWFDIEEALGLALLIPLAAECLVLLRAAVMTEAP